MNITTGQPLRRGSKIKLSITRNIKAFLQSREEIPFAYLFGSFVDEDYFRDIDLAIYIDEKHPLTRDKFYDIELSTRIEEFIAAPVPVDIVVLNQAPSAIVFYASKGKLLKNSDDDLRTDFITRHWKLYWDLQPIIDYCIKERKNDTQS